MGAQDDTERAGIAPRPFSLAVAEVTSTEGVTFTPWSNGWAVGFRVSHPDRPLRYVYLNPTSETDTRNVDDSDVFIYHGPDGAPDQEDLPLLFVNIWQKEEDL